MNYTKADKVRESITTTQTDPEIELIIADVSAYVDRYCGYKIGYDEQTETPSDLYFDGSGTRDLVLGLHVVGYDDVEENGVIITDETIGYPLNKPETGRLAHKIRNFTQELAGITLVNAKNGRYTVDWGNTGHNLPLDLQMAVTALVANIITGQDGGTTTAGGDIKSEKIGDYTITYTEGTTSGGETSKSDEVLAFDTLDSYRKKLIV